MNGDCAWTDMITVLDIDVDLFVDPYPTHSSRRQGRRAEDVTAWRPERVCEYIGGTEVLGSGRNLPGQKFETHDEMLGALADLESPVLLYHLDAHADLGVGQNCYRFYSEFLAIEPALRRSRLHEFRPREGDFLLYAIACGFVGAMDYVTHPDGYGRIPDIPVGMDRWEDGHTAGFLDLRRFHGTGAEYGNRQGKHTLDRSIPIHRHNRDEFRLSGMSFDYLYITRSPDYTPIASDNVVRAVQEAFLRS